MHIHTQELDIGEHSKLINLFQYILNGKYQSLFKNSTNKNEYSINHSASGVISHQDDNLLLGEKTGVCVVLNKCRLLYPIHYVLYYTVSN